MRRFDNFLRIFRRSPRREFSDSLYQRISGKKNGREALRQIAVWGLVSILVFTSLSTTLNNFNGQATVGPFSEQNETQIEFRAQHNNPALAAENGLQPAEFSPPPDKEDLLGPFDKPKTQPSVVVEYSGFIEVAVLAERQ